MQWAPGIQDQSANIIMQGNALSQRSGEEMTKIAGYFMDRANKSKALGQTILAYGGTDENGDPMYDKKMLDGMGVDEKEGLLKGMVLAQTQRKEQAEAQEQQARAASYRAIAAERQDRIDAGEAQGRGISRYLTAPGIDEPLTQGAMPTGYEPAPGVTSEPQTTTRPRTHFERIAYALGPEGLSGKFAAPTIKALNDLQDLTDTDPQAQWDTYRVPGSNAMAISKRGTKQTYIVPVTGEGPQVWTVNGQDYYQGPRGTLAAPVTAGGGEYGKPPTIMDLAQMHKVREQMFNQLKSFGLTPEDKVAQRAAIKEWDQQINAVTKQLGTAALAREARAQKKGVATGTPASGTPAGPAVKARATGVTKGNAVAGGTPSVKTQAQYDALDTSQGPVDYIGTDGRTYTKPQED